MDFLVSYDTYKYNNFQMPEFFWNESSQCLKINDFYLFVEKQIVVEKNQFEGNEKLNELFGLDMSSFIPKTVSDWVHLGVDGVSAIASAVPGVGSVISVVIDVIHAISYFIEGKIKNNQETLGLYLCGAITAVIPMIQIPAVKNVIGTILKTAGKVLKPGMFLVTILKHLLKLPINLAAKVISLLFRIDSLQKGIANILVKHSDTWWFKGLSKVPVIKQVIQFIKNDFSKAMGQVGEILVKDLNMFKVAVKNELPKLYTKAYQNSSLKNLFDEKSFLKLNMILADKELAAITKDTIGTTITKFGKEFNSGLAESTLKSLTAIEAKVTQELSQHLTDKVAKEILLNRVKKEAILMAVEKGTKEIPYNELIKRSIKTLAADTLKRLPVSLLKRLGIVAAKEVSKVVADEIQKEEPAAETNTQEAPEEPAAEEPAEEEPTEIISDETEDIREKFNLKVSSVENIDAIGGINLEFRTPDRSREEDDNSGKLILAETEIFEEISLTDKMSDYTSSEELLNDLKFVGKKDEDKERLRDRDLKKWQKTSALSTPFIKDINARFEFYFLARERAKISLFRKNHEEQINLSEFLKGIDEKGQLKLNGSLFLIAKKVA